MAEMHRLFGVPPAAPAYGLARSRGRAIRSYTAPGGTHKGIAPRGGIPLLSLTQHAPLLPPDVIGRIHRMALVPELKVEVRARR